MNKVPGIYDRTLILNEGGQILEVETLRLLIQSILAGITNAGQYEDEFVAALTPLIAEPLPWTEFIRQLSVVAARLRVDGRVGVDKYFEIAAAISAHDWETKECRQAYNADCKPNPAGVFWPNPTFREAKSVYEELPFCQAFPILDRATPIGSAGSCFAAEIARRLRADGFNYVVTESGVDTVTSSARWGILFNAPSLRQLVEKAFGLRRLPRLLWTDVREGRAKYFDPFRENVIFDSVEEYDADIEPHLNAAREALTQSRVFVMTLGMNEVWSLKSDGAVFSRCPWLIASAATRRHVLSVEENITELQRMLDLWRVYNRDLRLILTVSPVPMHATFRGAEHHVITANCHAKAVLRVAVEEFTRRNKEVYYFPSFETVMYCTRSPWAEDERHVSVAAVDKVMALFYRTFVIT